MKSNEKETNKNWWRFDRSKTTAALNTSILILIRYLPVVVSVWILFILVGNCGDSLFPLLGQSLIYNLLLFLLSIKYKFCFWHRAIILLNSFAVFLELIETTNNDFITIIDNTKLTTAIIGILIFTVYGTRKK